MMRATIYIAGLCAVLAAGGCRHENGAGFDGGIGDAGIPGEDDDAGLGPVCVSASAAVQTLGADVIFLLDTSYSMDYNLKWSSVSQALELFLQDPRFTGIGAGIQYFPLRATCEESDYATPAVAVGMLPAANTALTASIDAQRMAGGTPTVVAMQGVLDYAQQRAMANPTRRQVVVLATDGVPDDSCPADGDMGLPNTIDSVVSLVSNAAQGTPSVITFVIGVGSELTALNAIAQAGGGTQSALLVDTTADIQSEFSGALDQIRKVAFSCEFVIPDAPAGLQIDPNKVNVQFTDTATENLVYVGDAGGCGKAPTKGWYYDDPQNPKKVILCDQTCDVVRGTLNGQVGIVFGCSTIVP
ncbi:MAG TPA: vWA domain-containing protein [Polyangia bacterium]|nr:vWA domain-containing protein [Polyangia bacterium]